MRKLAPPVVALVATLLVGSGSAAARPVSVKQTGDPAGHTITLITGDRVRVLLGERPSIAVLPSPGREGVALQAFSERGRHYLIPLDAMPLVGSGRLDRRLFDLNALVEFGYTDEARDSVPVIVTRRPGAAATVAGLTETAALSSVDGTAAIVRKSEAAATWRRLSVAGGVEKVWLDGLRRPALDESVPQIGAPTAHRAGFTGAGVRVAVLDTGVDAGHPDLAGRVAASRNFTFEPDGDRSGHGTHVASTVAGSGAASGGRYRGVAYGATLLDGKVCAVSGCPESAIVAGMEWAAAEQDADVVNMSLGQPDSSETDPLEEAVDRLTAEHGTLFVAAAGNDGRAGSVYSPSTADAALSVGAVDKRDALAPTSSRGPRADGAIKPEVTAPGVDITAARAGSTPDPYVAASGTSMAAPHVAGAAALLAQRHPEWTAAQLKSALIATARPTAGVDVFAQGGGRVDAAAAIAQPLLIEPTTLVLGRQLWPHHDDQPVRRAITVRNTGTEDVTLTPRVEATGPDGRPAPPGLFTVDPAEVTVPAGGSATIGVTADTRFDGRDGRFSGWVVASGDGTRLAVPITIDKEVESYDVRFNVLNFDGAPETSSVSLVDLAGGDHYDLFAPDGSAVVRLPKATYLMLSTVFDPDPRRVAVLVQPSFVAAGETTVTLDARQARPVEVTVPEPAVTNVVTTAGYAQTSPHGLLTWFTTVMGYQLNLAHLGPPDAPGFVAHVGTQWATPDGAGWYDGSPEVYATFAVEHGRFFDGFRRRYGAGDFARVRAEHHTAAPDKWAHKLVAARPAGSAVFPLRFGVSLRYPLPFARTEFVAGGDDVRWSGSFDQWSTGLERTLLGDDRIYRAGRAYTERWNVPVFGPALPESYDPESWIVRTGDVIRGVAPMGGDGAGHYGLALTGTARTTLYRDGVKIGEQPGAPQFGFAVPPEPADYRLEVDTAPGTELSSRVTSTWTFRSAHVDAGTFQRLPLSAVRFSPPLDDTGGAPGGRPYLLPIAIERQGLPLSDLRRLTVEVSYDDGTTWRRAPLAGRLAVLHHPPGPGHVSLRAVVADRHGNTTEQTILRAYRLH